MELFPLSHPRSCRFGFALLVCSKSGLYSQLVCTYGLVAWMLVCLLSISRKAFPRFRPLVRTAGTIHRLTKTDASGDGEGRDGQQLVTYVQSELHRRSF